MANNQARARGLFVSVSSRGERIGASPAPAPAFCVLPTLAEIFAIRSAFTSSGGIQATGTRIAATAPDSSLVVVGDLANTFISASSLVQQNFVFNSMISTAPAPPQEFGIFFVFIDTVTFQVVCEFALMLRDTALTTGAALIDSLGGYSSPDILIDNLVIASGYEAALFIQTGGAGSAYMKDSLGNTFPLKFSGLYNPANTIAGAIQFNTGTELNDSISASFNQGSQAFGVTDPGAVSWCNA